MSSGNFSFSGDRVELEGRSWRVEYPIKDAILLGGRVVVLYDPDSIKATLFRSRQFRNLVAYSAGGEKLWVAEHPTNETADVYISFISVIPLKVWNFGCYVCEINPADGKLIKAEFTK